MTSGIAKIRSQVSGFGRFQCCPDSAHRLEVVNTGPKQPLHAAEMAEQRASLGRSKPRHRFEHGFVVPAGATLAVAGDRETMRFIANSLDHA